MDESEKFMRRAGLALMVAFGTALAIPIYLTRSPPPPISLANGTYYNPCCGKLRLQNGMMSFAAGTVRYKIILPKTDLMLEPESDVVVKDGRIITVVTGRHQNYIWSWRFPYRNNTLLRYDPAVKPPDRLSLYGDDLSGPYDFALISR